MRSCQGSHFCAWHRSRLILTDLLGTGSSDAVLIHDCPAMQAWTDGLVAVLDAVGSECVTKASSLTIRLMNRIWSAVNFDSSRWCRTLRQHPRDPSRRVSG
jgi:hypothetical protein